MKKTLAMATLLFLFIQLAGFGQNRSITFIDKPVAELLKMAKAQNKLVFVDGFTTWCGPCKWMAANMFTNDTIADYYNKTFICAHFDMEKGEGPEIAKTFQVMAYPTLLFINGDGELVHKRVGVAQKVRDYLDMGAVALTPGESFTACLKQYQAGNRDQKFIMKFCERLKEAYMPFDDPVQQYFATHKESSLTSRGNWDMIYNYLSDINSSVFEYLLHHQKEYMKLYTKDSVNAKIYSVFFQAITAGNKNKAASDSNFKELTQKIKNSGFEEAGMVIFDGTLNLHVMRGELDKFLDLAVSGLDTYYSGDYVKLNKMAFTFSQLTKEKKYLEKAAEWAKKAIVLKNSAENNDTYANLMFKLGNKGEAVKYEQKALDAAIQEKISTKPFETSLKIFKQ